MEMNERIEWVERALAHTNQAIHLYCRGADLIGTNNDKARFLREIADTEMATAETIMEMLDSIAVEV